MTVIRDIQVIKAAQANAVEPNRLFEPGVLVFVDSTDTDKTAMVNGRPEYVWYKTFNQPQAVGIILNRAVPSIAGQTVKIGYPEKPPFERQVLGLYDLSQVQDSDQTGGGSLITAPHAQSHQWPTPSTPGTDPVKIFQPALLQFKTEGDGTSLSVLVNPLPAYRYQEYIRSYQGGAIDMTPYVPATVGMHRYVLIYLDVATMFIQLVLGTEGVTAVFPPEPKLPVGGIASAFVLLENGQTVISTEDDITDKRAFISAYTDEQGVTGFTWIWDDEVARLAETAVSQDNVDNYATGLQLDEGTIWRASSVTPDWTLLSGGNSGYVHRPPGSFVKHHKREYLYSLETTFDDASPREVLVDGVDVLFPNSNSILVYDFMLMGISQHPLNVDEYYDFRVQGTIRRSVTVSTGNESITVRYADRAGIALTVSVAIAGISFYVSDSTASGDLFEWNGRLVVSSLKYG